MRRLLICCGLSAFAFAQNGGYKGVASSKQIMAGIQKPAMDSLAAMMKAGGPKDDKEWELAQQQAALLAETAQLLTMGARPKDQEIWMTSSHRLQEAAIASKTAAGAKDLDAWKASLGNMGKACKSCHDVHRPKKQ